MKTFEERVMETQPEPLRARGIAILQLNLGYVCTRACKHCHIAAGPDRKESMDSETVEAALSALKSHDLETLDLTGGSPELNPFFRHLVREARKAGRRVVVRSNMTIYFEEGLQDLPEFYRDHEVDVVASLPHYTRAAVDTVRGNGAFEKSIASLRRLNSLGYGSGREGRRLHLVYNPTGAFLPPPQATLEEQYRRELRAGFGVVFDRLYAFANMPIGRFRDFLVRTGALETYMAQAAKAFNPAALEGLMCRHLISVGWNGRLYDCDFNQVLGLAVDKGSPSHIGDFDLSSLAGRRISTDSHCFVCAAGQGST